MESNKQFKAKFSAFEEAVKPIQEWLKEHGKSYSVVLIDAGKARLLEGAISVPFYKEESRC